MTQHIRPLDFQHRYSREGGGRLLHGKTSWTLYYDYTNQDNEETLIVRGLICENTS